MKILYDYQAFAMQKFGGVSRCFSELSKHLPSDVEYEITIKESNNVYIKNQIDGIRPPGDKFNRFLLKGNFKGKWHLHHLYDKITMGHYYPNYNQNITIKTLKEGNFDIFHPTFFEDYFLPYLKAKPFVLTIHDMIPERYPQYFTRDYFQIINKRKLAKIANAIVAVSENTKKDIIEILDIPEEKIHVIYHGCSFMITNNPKRLINQPYILYVGTRNQYKNFNLFIKHTLTFLHNHPNFVVVCTGPAFSSEETKMLREYGLVERVIHYWALSDEEFYSLYHYAMCFVYPSEYEGFGIPILEAYASDCPVLLNKSSCFPEIAGDAAIYFEMNYENSNISEKMEYISNMSIEGKQKFLDKQKKRLSLYSWRKSAEQLCEVYKSLL